MRTQFTKHISVILVFTVYPLSDNDEQDSGQNPISEDEKKFSHIFIMCRLNFSPTLKPLAIWPVNQNRSDHNDRIVCEKGKK